LLYVKIKKKSGENCEVIIDNPNSRCLFFLTYLLFPEFTTQLPRNQVKKGVSGEPVVFRGLMAEEEAGEEGAQAGSKRLN
jgi:hypothetical protein